MTSGGLGDVLRIFGGESTASLGDGELLGRFADRGDATAFEALAARLGPMVLGTCRRMLSDSHDVEDAFQATFLVLVRRAGSIRDRDLVGPWLHGVATRVARRARADAARRSAGERLERVKVARQAEPDLELSELRALIDEEIERLPEHHRRPVVLCDVEGLSREEAALRLGWTSNMLRGRLARARDRLRGRLAHHGMAPSGAWIVLGVRPPVLPPALLASTTRAALSFAVVRMGTGLASASAVALSRGVLRMMILSKLKVGLSAGIVSLMVVVAVVGSQPRSIAARQGGPQVAKQQVAPPAARREGRRLPDVAGPPAGGPFKVKAPDPKAPKVDLDAAPKSLAVRISGVVRDLADRPIAGATVYAFGIQILDDPKLTIDTTLVGTATTDQGGSYNFAGVEVPTSRQRHVPQALTPHVRYKVVAKAPGFGLGWHQDEAMYAINPPDPDDIQGYAALGSPAEMSVYLRPEADLKGRVVDEDGKPVAGVKIDLNDVILMDERQMETTVDINMLAKDWPAGLGRAVTDADGRFRLPGLPAESCCLLTFQRPDSNGSRWLYASTLADTRTNHGEPEHHNGRGPHEVYPKDMTVSMPSTRTIEVHVVADDDGKPVPGVSVYSMGETLATGVTAGGTTDAEGLARLDLPPGRYKGLHADPGSLDSRFIRTFLKEFEIAAVPRVQKLELRMKPGFELLLEAVDEATGHGIPGIHFEITSDEPNGSPRPQVRSSTFIQGPDASGADGKLRAVLTPAPGPLYRVRVLGAERVAQPFPVPTNYRPIEELPYDVAPKLSDPFELAAGKAANFRFTLKKK